ncbi:MAG: DNA-binding protein WhiA [Acholeplasmataceae bacterium]|jgi:DNA-binding protein WhiA|nr:DNA-binding protein WhiA [Acholeplasmataceae bacterium]
MSFAKTVKEELVSLPVELEGQLAEFSAFLNMNAEFHIEAKLKMIDFKTNNPTVAKRFLQLVRTLYQAETSLIKKKTNQLKAKHAIIVRIQSKVEDIINEHSYLDNSIESQEMFTQSYEAKRAYLRAAFLSSGSVNHPKTANYHLEIFSRDKNQVIFMQSLMNFFDLNAKITTRRNGLIVYLKDAEGISGFLQVTGAQNSVFQFEDLRIKRDFNNSINRIMNCEIANEKKIFVAATEQLKDIELIEAFIPEHYIDEKMKKVMHIRKDNPESSLQELTTIYEETYEETISKSGMNHRLHKIKLLAEQIREGQTS